MSPLRLNSSIFTASSCLHQLSVRTWQNSIMLRTMEIQRRLTPVTFVWRPAWCLASFHDGWRVYVNSATDGDLCRATSADIILLSALLYQSRFPCVFTETGEDRGKSRRSSVLGKLICQKVHQDRRNNLPSPDRPFTLPFSDIDCCQTDSAADLFPCGRQRKVTVRQLSSKVEIGTDIKTNLLWMS